MKSALHKDARAAQSDRFVNPIADFFKRMNICVGLSRSAIECTECADDVADVRVIDIAVNDVCNDFRIVFSLTNLVRRRADFGDVIALQKPSAVFGGHPFAV